MRITNSMLRESALRSLSGSVAEMSRVQEQVSTTRRINRPSDDPAQIREAVKLRDGIAELEQYLRNIDTAGRTLSAAEAAMATAGDALQRARELAIQGANSTLSPADRLAIAQEIGQLAEQVHQYASAKVGESYIFSGFRSNQPPFPSAVGAYQGDQGAIMARISPGTTVQTNVTADVAFAPALDALKTLQAELSSGALVSSGTITSLDTGLDALLQARATVGARQNRIEETALYLSDAAIGAKKLLSDTVDADLAEAISKLTERQSTYQAALAVSGRILQNSLIDELR